MDTSSPALVRSRRSIATVAQLLQDGERAGGGGTGRSGPRCRLGASGGVIEPMQETTSEGSGDRG